MSQPAGTLGHELNESDAEVNESDAEENDEDTDTVLWGVRWVPRTRP